MRLLGDLDEIQGRLDQLRDDLRAVLGEEPARERLRLTRTGVPPSAGTVAGPPAGGYRVEKQYVRPPG
jgi:hypothetical protein